MNKYNKIRLKALLIDIGFITVLWIIIYTLYIVLSHKGTKLDNIGLALFLSLFLCKDNINGQSFGKRICKLKVVDYKGKKLNLIKLIGRNLFIFLAPIEFVLMLYYNKRIGDKFIKSKVIAIKESSKISFMNILISLLILFLTTIIWLPLV